MVIKCTRIADPEIFIPGVSNSDNTYKPKPGKKNPNKQTYKQTNNNNNNNKTTNKKQTKKP
jgi:hypothetical protein